MSLTSLFNSKVNILRITKTASAMGQTEAKNVLHNNLPCRINWKRGSEKIFFAKDTYFRDGKLFCRVVDITNKDRVQYKSKTYQIVDVNNTDESNRFLVLDLRIIK